MLVSKRFFFLVISLIFSLNNAFAFFSLETQNPDSLLKKARELHDPTAQIELAKQACQIASHENNPIVYIKSLNLISDLNWDLRHYDTAKVYAQNALSAARKNNIDSLMGDAWLSLGMADYGKGIFKQAIEQYKQAVAIYKKYNKRSSLATAYLNIGVSERKLSQYLGAVNYFLLSSGIFESLKDKESLSYVYNSISICFIELQDYPKALFYSKKAFIIRQESANKQLVAQSLNNIGFAFYKYHRPDSAIHYLNKALVTYGHDKDSSQLVLTLQNLGVSWRDKGNLKKASDYIIRAQKIAAIYKMGEELARGNADLAELYLHQKKYPQALAAINITIDTARKQRLSELLLQAYTIKYKIYKQTGDYKNALLFADKKDALNDTLFTIAKNKAVGETETKYQTKQKERDIVSWREKAGLQQKINTQKTVYIIVLAFAAVLLAILFVIAYNNFRKKNKANQRIQTLMRDLHHRVKNNLQILQGLFSMQIDNLSDEKTKNALRENEARLTSMNLIHSRLYLDNTTTKIEMNDYLTKLLNHIKDSFGGYGQSEINLKIEVSNIMLEADKAVAIGLIANELTTNSFKYAFNGQGGEIHLALQLIEKSKILLTLGDNGVGLKPENKDKAPSFGLKLVNLMARQLNSTLVVKSDPGVFYQMEISI